MIAWLNGVIAEIDDSEIVIDVNGVGYLVAVGLSLLRDNDYQIGDPIRLPIYTSVKEDDIRLFGFKDNLGRRLFKILLGVNGVGPKVALAILDSMTNEAIIRSVNISDFTGFVKVPGVGKKTAQRIILDIQGKITDLLLTQPDIQESIGQDERVPVRSEVENLLEDAGSALSNLGFHEKLTTKIIKKHLETSTSLDEIIRKSLADLRQGK